MVGIGGSKETSAISMLMGPRASPLGDSCPPGVFLIVASCKNSLKSSQWSISFRSRGQRRGCGAAVCPGGPRGRGPLLQQPVPAGGSQCRPRAGVWEHPEADASGKALT